MSVAGNVALELLTSCWVLQSAAALVKTRKAARLFGEHRRWLDGKVKPYEKRRVALVIAVKGVSENFERFMDFALGQDYPDYRVIFVTESENDPAHPAIRARMEGSGRATLIVAGAAANTGQKVHNQLAAFRALENADRIVAFADGDLFGRKDWLSCLVLPLNMAQADCSTGYRWFVPADQSMPNRVVTLIGTAIEPLIGPNWRMCLWGGSMAVTREIFEELEIPKNLEGSINDDARISQLARRAGKRMRYVRSVAAPSPVDFDWAALFEFGRRQYFQLRIYQPLLWWMALMIPLLFLASFSTCLVRLGMGELHMLVFIGVAVLLNLKRTEVRRGYLKYRFDQGEAAPLDEAVKGSWWLDPLINVVHLLIILSSACGRQIVWAGIRYRVTAPQKTEILRR
ncbi:glycosyltransferase family 2 protein [Luteolibacter yonseiensis]|uniref:Glycosyltransferase family 2 protein n=1 Tax=Luteolibacter yonseiensis TaxID=1144680 RepID=A0A934VAP6_9BACT|nr:glycosyltransferase family 2 protein [Luteolibacter yonseiensis]MBK1816413.1 glycosyltransferase family 2 protein [Luteolibacter yonseiensis]